MLFRPSRILLTGALALVLLGLRAGTVKALPADVGYHWARSAIQSLTKQGVLKGYPDGTFKPDRFVSRAEFARMTVKTFGLPADGSGSFKDTVRHWAKNDIAALVKSGALNGYPDGSFRPDQPITRAEAAAALNRLLGLGAKEQVFGSAWTEVFPDVARNHWAFRHIELARRLGILPASYSPVFRPEAVATRAETAWMLDRAEQLQQKKGLAIEVNPGAGLITVVPADGAGEPSSFEVDPEALVLRNNAEVALDKVLIDDKVLALVDSTGQAKVVMTSGKVNTDDLLSRLGGMTRGALDPETIAAIVRGDWSGAQAGLNNVLFDRLIEMGLSPGEAQSLLDQDWVSLDLMSRDQLVDALATRLGLPADLSAAILSRDLGQVKEMLRTELTAMALGRLLGTSS